MSELKSLCNKFYKTNAAAFALVALVFFFYL